MANRSIVSDRVAKIGKSAIHEMTRLSRDVEDVAFLSWAKPTSGTPEHINAGAIEAIRKGRQPFTDVEVGRDAVLTSLLGRKAIYERRTVEWDELLKDGAPPLPPEARFV